MRVGIALGSNLGDRMANLRSAVAEIRQFAELPFLVSGVYETAPVDCPPGSPAFLNAAVEIGYSGDLSQLLTKLQAIEQSLGRPELRGRNSPRTVDLDILYADDLTLERPDLKVPHPRLMSRPFVLLPLNDITPNRKLPGESVTIATHLKTLDIGDCKFIQISINE